MSATPGNLKGNIYRGLRYHTVGGGEEAVVHLNGVKFTPTESLKIRRHSPDGFEWGYGGSGPAQLALAILVQEELPPELYQEFKEETIAKLDREEWTLTTPQVRRAVKRIQERAAA